MAIDLFSLEIDWPRVIIPAAVLIFPLPLVFSKKTQYRALDQHWGKRVPKALSFPWHWIDAARSLIGIFYLLKALELHQEGLMDHKRAMVVLGAILMAAICVQTISCKHEDTFHAPYLFVVAIVAIVFQPIIAGLSVVCGVTLAFAFRSGAAFFWAVPLGFTVLGLFLQPEKVLIAVMAGVVIVPLLLPILFQRDMVLAHRPIEEEPLPELK